MAVWLQNVLQMRKSLTTYGNSESAGALLKAFLVEAQVMGEGEGEGWLSSGAVLGLGLVGGSWCLTHAAVPVPACTRHTGPLALRTARWDRLSPSPTLTQTLTRREPELLGGLGS
jgi:hypothetical protein